MFVMDGRRISSNVSKEWSDTKESFEKKATKMKKVIRRLGEKHREEDKNDQPFGLPSSNS